MKRILAAFAVLSLFGAGCFSTWQDLPAGTGQTPTNPEVGAQATTSTPTSTSATPAPVPAPAPTPKPVAKPAPKPAPAPAHQTATVRIVGHAFSPQVIAVNAGDTVVWVNDDSVPHTTHSDGALLWDSGTITPGHSYSHVFNAVGTYPYSCGIHPDMHGTVVVH